MILAGSEDGGTFGLQPKRILALAISASAPKSQRYFCFMLNSYFDGLMPDSVIDLISYRVYVPAYRNGDMPNFGAYGGFLTARCGVENAAV